MTITSSRAAGPAIALLCAALLAACGDPRCPRGYLQKGDTCYRIKDAGALDASEDPVEPGGDDAGDDPEGDGASELPNGDAGAPGGASQDAAQSAFDADGSSPSRDADTSEAATGPGDADTTAPDAGGANDASAPDAASPATCASQPCQNGGTCMDGASGFTCRCSEPYTGDRCELEICGSTTIRLPTDLEAASVCAEIRGDLNLATAGLSEINLPSLARVTGALTITPGNNGSQAPLVQTLSVPRLESVGSMLIQSVPSGAMAELAFPRLVETSGIVNIVGTLTKALRFPALTRIGGSFNLMSAPKLCTFDMRKITSVEGALNVGSLINLPVSALEPLRAAARGTPPVGKVGCCYQVERYACTELTAAERMQCGC